MGKLNNAQLVVSGNAESDNAIQFRADTCKCGATQCDYTATSTAAITAVHLGGDFDGSELDLPAASYPVSEDGAEDLQADLLELLDGVAEGVTVTYNDLETDTLVITVTNSIIVMKKVNSATNFTASNCGGTGE